MTTSTTTAATATTAPTATSDAAVPLAPGTWALDAAHTSVAFTIRRLGLSKVRGRFGAVDAELVVGERLEDTRVTATIDLASIDTGNPDRDAHVRAPDLLDVARRPTITFRSTAVRGDGDGWAADGELTIGDVTRPLTLEVGFGGVQDFVDGTRHASFEATGEIRRRDYGLGFGAIGAALGEVVRFELDLEFIEPPL